MHVAVFSRLFLVICGCVTVFGADVTTICPPRLFDGVIYSVLCRLNTSTLNDPGKCVTVTAVNFETVSDINYNGTTFGTNSYPVCSTANNDVRCVNTTSNVAFYELLFRADKATFNQKTLQCKTNCFEYDQGKITYNYTSCTNITINDKPAARHNCPKYVSVGQSLTCICDGGVDTPPGVFSWAHSTGSASLVLDNVLRSDNGTRYRCQAVWIIGTVATHDDYTLNVVYGPDNVSASGPDPFDTNGSQDMILTCSASEVNPSPTIKWTRQSVHGFIHVGQSYTFRPQPPGEDGSEFKCQAQNTISNETRSTTLTVHLHYPPTTYPIITNNSKDANLYQGDIVIFTCTVSGGKPVNATYVSLKCPGKESAEVIVGSTEVSSSVTLNPVSDSDHNRVCTCNTRWKQTNWYTNNASSTLFFINIPPSPPNITVTAGDYPPIAGSIMGINLTCVSSIPGRPAASYEWLVTGAGQPGVDGLRRGTLTFNRLSKEDDGQTVTCRASNLYTKNRQPVPDGNFTLRVFYPPLITLSAHQGSACHVTTSSICEVTEGQKVSIICDANSNPAPASVTWHLNGGTTIQSTELSIMAANHTVDNGQYNCTVKTGPLGNGRPPLMSSQKMTVLVKYKPTKSYLTVNRRHNTTVDENDSVVFECLADGRPTPTMELRNDADVLGEPLPGGEVVLEDRDTRLNYTLLSAQCEHTGVYWCTASNSVRVESQSSAMLYVNCRPRAAEPVSKEPPSANFVNQAVQLSLKVVAYPLPRNFNFSYLGPAANKSSIRKKVDDSILNITCRSTDALYKVTCNVTVENITSADQAGHYSVRVANDIGAVELDFLITFKKITPGTPEPWAAVGGGIAGAAALAVIAIIVVVFIRRQRQAGPDQARNGFLSRKMEGRNQWEAEMKVKSSYATESDINDDETMIVNNLYGTADGAAAHESQARAPQRSEYEDVGLPPAVKPHVEPKPLIAAKKSTANDEKDTNSIVQKGSNPVRNPADTVAYASVDKSNTATLSGQNAEADVRTRTTAKNKSEAMQKPAKKTQQDKNKSKKKAQRETKEDDRKLRKRPDHTEGAVFGNVPLSMNPIDCKVYENFGFQTEESVTKHRDPPQQPAADQRSTNKDGLVYTTIQFTESQQKKAEHNPPKRETTEYVSIAFSK